MNLRRILGSLPVVLLGACASSSGDAGSGAAASAGHGSATSPAAEERLEGTLEYRELPPTQSVEAYLGVEFTLKDAAGTAHALEPSERVPRAALVAQAGKRVAVTGVWFVPPPPDANSPAPLDPAGKPLARPGRYRVTSVPPLGP